MSPLVPPCRRSKSVPPPDGAIRFVESALDVLADEVERQIGRCTVDSAPIPGELEEHTDRAVESCPTLALLLARHARD